MSGDPRAQYLHNEGGDTTAPGAKPKQGEGISQPGVGDPRAAWMGGSAVEPAQDAPPVDEKLSSEGDMTPGEEYRLMQQIATEGGPVETVGDPRNFAAAGIDTTAPVHSIPPKDTGVHMVGTGDPRAAWQSNAAVEPVTDPAAAQEERDLKAAMEASLKEAGLPASDGAAQQPIQGDPRASWMHQVGCLCVGLPALNGEKDLTGDHKKTPKQPQEEADITPSDPRARWL